MRCQYDGIGGVLATASGAMSGGLDARPAAYAQAASADTLIQVDIGMEVMNLSTKRSTASAPFLFLDPRSFKTGSDMMAPLPSLTISAIPVAA